MITQISANELLVAAREQLGIPASSAIDETMLAAMVRRAAGIHCPCSLATLTAAVVESLAYLTDASAELEERVRATGEGLVVLGDLLELSQVTVDDPNAKGTGVFSAPPGFIVRPSGSVFLVGIVPDEANPLPASLSCRIECNGAARLLTPAQEETLPSVLRELGLREISVSGWLKPPKAVSAIALRDDYLSRLSAQPPSGEITDVSILVPDRAVEYYRRRWAPPEHHTGEFVARRPQAYGGALWGFAHLESGNVTQFLDFPLKGTRWRGCDLAWHLQMAIDQTRGTPQKYRKRPAANGVYLDFFSPIPLWAERRLCIVGRVIAPEHCLLSYWVPEREIATEETHLQEYLWLKATGS
jgi:hypothetical protein